MSGATQILAGDRASCALVKGTVHCWGELHGPKDARSRLARPTRIAGVDRVTAIAMGYQAYCALLADRSVTCWGHLEGDRERRTLELGGPVRSIAISGSLLLAVLETRAAVNAWVDQDAVPSPVPVAHPVQVSCASSHCCALDENRRAVCWGSNGHGQLGDPDQGYGGESQKPVAVAL